MNQQNLLVKVEPDFTHQVTEKTGAAWTESAVLWRSQYQECALRLNSLIDVIRELE